MKQIKRIALLLTTALPLFLSTHCDVKDQTTPYLLDSLLNHEVDRHFYFTRPGLPLLNDARQRARSTLIRLIQNSHTSIEIWCYGFDDERVTRALVEARNRGISIHVLGSPDSDYNSLEGAGFSVLRRARSGLQHVKAVLIDRKVLFSGTGNFTTSGFLHNNNAFFHMTLTPHAANQFAMMLNEESAMSLPPGILLPFSGRAYASPRDGDRIQMHIVSAILGARFEIRGMIFSHTDPIVTAALLIQAARGVNVHVIYDDPYNQGELNPDSEAAYLNAYGGATTRVYLDGNRSVFQKGEHWHGGHMHHKTLIIDRSLVLTGSYNWSLSARDRNLEVLYEFRDAGVAREFLREFDLNRERALLLGHSFAMPGNALHFREHKAGDRLMLCVEAQSSGDRLTFFHEARNRLQHVSHFVASAFQTSMTIDSIAYRCAYAEDTHNASSLLSRGSTYRSNGFQKGSSVVALPAAIQPGIPGRSVWPCAGGCENVRVKQMNAGTGTVWILDEKAEFREMLVFDRNGLSNPIPIADAGSGLYTFPPLDISGDAILFFRGDDQETYSCLKSGESLNATVDYVRRQLTEPGLPPPFCAPID